MTWSHTAVPIYLYGRSALVSRDASGRVTDASERLIESFDKRGVAIKPFFDQPESKHVSAVVFSNAGTLSKFKNIWEWYFRTLTYLIIFQFWTISR
jgi:hypothetical protein